MTDFATRPDQEALEAAKREMAICLGLDCEIGVATARIITAYLAKMPRAWAHESKCGHLFRVTHDKEAADELSRRMGGKTLLVALVPVKDDSQ